MSDANKNEDTVTEDLQQQPEPKTSAPSKGAKEGGKPERRSRSNAPKEEPREPVLVLGRVVRYVTGNETERPAMVTRINEDETVDLTVFNSQGAVPAVGVERDDDKQPGTYHWPEWV